MRVEKQNTYKPHAVCYFGFCFFSTKLMGYGFLVLMLGGNWVLSACDHVRELVIRRTPCGTEVTHPREIFISPGNGWLVDCGSRHYYKLYKY